jgi:hypothetical protein
MDDQAKFEALRSEFEVEPGYLVRPDGTSKLVYVRAVQDAGGLEGSISRLIQTMASSFSL